MYYAILQTEKLNILYHRTKAPRSATKFHKMSAGINKTVDRKAKIDQLQSLRVKLKFILVSAIGNVTLN